MKEIVAALQQETSKETVTWAQKTLGCLNTMSPLSLTVALQNIRSATTLSLVQCLRRDFDLTQKFIIRPDMRQGVLQTLVQRSAQVIPTQWAPATLDQVNEALTEFDFFCTHSPHSLTMATPLDFVQYPYRHYMLPSEAEIKQMVVEASAAAAAAGKAAITMNMTQVGCYGMTIGQAVIYFSRQRNGKQGVRQKVTEILARKTRTVPGPNGLATLEWIE
jgi:3-hydroxyisobutyryl-CoA hydrolase